LGGATLLVAGLGIAGGTDGLAVGRGADVELDVLALAFALGIDCEPDALGFCGLGGGTVGGRLRGGGFAGGLSFG
jgi:hypothetical protein